MRDRFNAFIERHDVAWELGMALLAVLYVSVGLALDEATPPLTSALEGAELTLTGIFALEFGSRFAASRDRAGYLRGHWIDLVALIPIARGLRVARLLRLLRLVRSFAGVYRALSHVAAIANHRGLTTIVLAWLGVMLICCTAVYFVERDVNENIKNPFDALWWGIATLTTVGYGDVYPVTPEGRVAAGALMLLGIGLFSAVTAIVTSYLLGTGNASTDDPIAMLERLDRLRRNGVITELEFNSKRSDLLARL